jgi:LacI family transcriptional regulator
VRFPHYQLGTEAAQLLLERINGGEGPVKILYLAPELIVRGSTAERPAQAADDADDADGAASRPVPLHPASPERASSDRVPSRRTRGASPA